MRVNISIYVYVHTLYTHANIYMYVHLYKNERTKNFLKTQTIIFSFSFFSNNMSRKSSVGSQGPTSLPSWSRNGSRCAGTATNQNTFHVSGAACVQPGLCSRAAAEGSAGQTTRQNSSTSWCWGRCDGCRAQNLPGWKEWFLRSCGNVCQVFRFPPPRFFHPEYKKNQLSYWFNRWRRHRTETLIAFLFSWFVLFETKAFKAARPTNRAPTHWWP